MSTTQHPARNTDWWDRIGLRYGGLHMRGGAINASVRRAAEETLREHPPIAFAAAPGAEPLTLEELDALLIERGQQAQAKAKRDKARGERERSELGWQRIREAFERPDAGEVITDGGWAGMTRGEAFAWCWNLFQYEPRGLISPGSWVRRKAMEDLLAWQLPEVFGYPERAKEIAANDVTPQEYRRAKEISGSGTFTPEDVTFG